MIYPAAFNTVTGPMHWDLLIRSRALDNNVHDPFAKCLATTSFEEDIIITEIDLQRNIDIEQQIPSWKQKREDLYNISGKSKF